MMELWGYWVGELVTIITSINLYAEYEGEDQIDNGHNRSFRIYELKNFRVDSRDAFESSRDEFESNKISKIGFELWTSRN